MKTVTVNLNKELEDMIQELIDLQIYPNRSECIRSAIRNLLLYYNKLPIKKNDTNRAEIFFQRQNSLSFVEK